MTKEAARAFHERIKIDETLAGKVVELGAAMSDQDMVRIAKEAGFDCTVEELDAVGMELGSELGDKALDAVVGGTGPALPGAPIVPSPEVKATPGVQNLTYTAVAGVRDGSVRPVNPSGRTF
jgi:predicted ribosomally synthesized peptide with nif11-like leader